MSDYHRGWRSWPGPEHLSCPLRQGWATQSALWPGHDGQGARLRL